MITNVNSNAQFSFLKCSLYTILQRTWKMLQLLTKTLKIEKQVYFKHHFAYNLIGVAFKTNECTIFFLEIP